jgi:hypothetical protein
MRFTLDTDNDTVTFGDGLVFSMKFIHTHLKSPKGTIIEFLGSTDMGPVTMKTHPEGSTVVPPGPLLPNVPQGTPRSL